MLSDLLRLPAALRAMPAEEKAPHDLPRQLIDYLARQISQPERAPSVVAAVDGFRALPPGKQHESVTATYLLLEQYLVELDPRKKFLKEQLREIVKTRFGDLVQSSEEFSLLFQPTQRQEVLLCRS